MFRRIVPVAHPEERDFPADLRKLGFFINDEDQLRQIEKPEEGFNYFVSKKIERINEKRREAVDECLRREVIGRLEAEGMEKHFLPPYPEDQGPPPSPVWYTKDDQNRPLSPIATTSNSGERAISPEAPFPTSKEAIFPGHTHKAIPILIDKSLPTASKILIIIPNNCDDLGVWSVREMESKDSGAGISHGSMHNTVRSAQAAGFAVVILNCGQTFYLPELGRAVTYRSWKAATKNMNPFVDVKKHKIEGHEDANAHVREAMDYVGGLVFGREGKARKRDVYVLAYGWGCLAGLKYWDDVAKFKQWRPSLQAMVGVESTHSVSDITNSELINFLKTRTRMYIVHGDPPGTFVTDKRFICQTFSSQQMYSECITPNMYPEMLKWFKRVEEDPEGCNPIVEVDWNEIERLQRENGWGVPEKDEEDPDKWRFEPLPEPEAADNALAAQAGMMAGGLDEFIDLRDEDKNLEDAFEAMGITERAATSPGSATSVSSQSGTIAPAPAPTETVVTPSEAVPAAPTEPVTAAPSSVEKEETKQAEENQEDKGKAPAVLASA